MAETVFNPVKEDLTGFLTRKSFEAFLETLNDAQSIGVISVQISRFGVVNDSVGSDIGDKIIATTAKRLGKICPDAAAIGRLHGDHFGMVFLDYTDIAQEVDRLLDFAQRPLAIRGEVIVLSIRIGVAESFTIDASAKDLVHAAEVALHNAKESKSKVVYFDGHMIDKARSIYKLENDLRVSLVTNAAELHQAISNSEFELYYQPIVYSQSNKLHAFEALLRWNHPKRGVVSPALFIPMAEQIGLMTVLGSWIIRKACSDAMSWLKNADGSTISVSINVSPTQFFEPKILMQSLKTAIQESKIKPSCVNLEITESADFAPVMHDYLQQIRKLGCKVAMDDFGTGYSSIAKLVDLPIDYVKIDRSLVKDLESDNPTSVERAKRISNSVLKLADSLDLTSIVEGIETAEGVRAIQKLGADLIQGYAYSKPLPLADVNTFITTLQKEH